MTGPMVTQGRTDMSAAAEVPAPSAATQNIALVVAMLLVVVWGVNFSLQKYLYAHITPEGFLMARYLVTSACTLLLMRWQFGRWWPHVSREDLRQLAWLGILGHALHVGLANYGVHWSTAFSSAVMLAFGPVFILLILRLKKIERLGRVQVLGVGIALAGVLLFLSDKLLAAQWRAGLGDALLLLGAFFFAWYTVEAKAVTQRLGAPVVVGYSTLLGAVPVLVWTVPSGVQVSWLSLEPVTWLCLAWCLVVSAFGGWLAWGWINAVRGVARTAPLMYVTPPVAGLVAWAFAGEHYTASKIMAAVVILLGVAVAQYAGPLHRRWSS